MFIHFGVLHVFFNMLALVSFGPLVERLYGSVTYLAIYLLAGVLGNLASISWHPAVNSAGASGAIFGILGALLGALVGGGERFPRDISRAIRYSTLVFLAWSLYVSFRSPGIDYAAHLGGLAAGFVLGVAVTPPLDGAKLYTREHIMGLLPLIPVAALLLTGGFWWAQRSAASLAGDGAYYHTVHWMRSQGHVVNSEFNAARRRNKEHPGALAETLEKTVVPFWREADARLAKIELPVSSLNGDALDHLQEVTDRCVETYQLLDEGLRDNDPKVIARAGQELREINQLAVKRGETRP